MYIKFLTQLLLASRITTPKHLFSTEKKCHLNKEFKVAFLYTSYENSLLLLIFRANLQKEPYFVPLLSLGVQSHDSQWTQLHCTSLSTASLISVCLLLLTSEHISVKTEPPTGTTLLKSVSTFNTFLNINYISTKIEQTIFLRLYHHRYSQ